MYLDMKKITSLEMLEDVYGQPVERALWKEIDRINDHYRQFIEASPFLILATSGDKGIDCSPRGDPAGFVKVVDEVPDALLEFLYGCKTGSFKQSSHEDRKPTFNLVEPGGMLGRIDKANTMRFIL